LALLRDDRIATRIVELGRLRAAARSRLWRRPTGWELRRDGFVVVCAKCCLEDLEQGRVPYGRLRWQQAWCTQCEKHGTPLQLRCGADEFGWDDRLLSGAAHSVARDRFIQTHLERVPAVRLAMFKALADIQQAAADAVAGITPRRSIWGALAPEEFLLVLRDVITWALTHFETVPAWTPAEDLTPVERMEGSRLIGRHRRLSPWDCWAGRARTLADVADPFVRASGLWLAHSLMAATHIDAPDRRTGPRPQDRQLARLAGVAPVSLEWLADRMRAWPRHYRRHRWINLRVGLQTAAGRAGLDRNY
jgi:hypothetical protein